jgi:fumarate hydratase class II
MADIRKESDSLGIVEVPADKLWGAQTQRSLEHFSIGHDLIPREMIAAYATLKKAAAIANNASKRLEDQRCKLIVQVCDEILAGQHHDMFPLHVWMTGSGTQFNMNVNEVISNRCSQIAGTPLGSKTPVHPNDPCQSGAIVERYISFGNVHCRHGEYEATSCASSCDAARRVRRKSQATGAVSSRSAAHTYRTPLL